MAEHTGGTTGTIRPLAPVVRTCAGTAVVSLVVGCIGFGVVGHAWYAAATGLIRAGLIGVIALVFEAFGLGWTAAADDSQPLASATIEAPTRTAWRVLVTLVLVAAFGAALTVAFDGVETIFAVFATAAGILGCWAVGYRRWELRTGRTLLQGRGGRFRWRGPELSNVPAAAIRRTRPTGAA